MYDSAEVYLKTINWEARLCKELPLLEEIIGNLKQQSSILDIGCGPGIHATQLAKQFPKHRFLGIDVDEGMIGIARDDSKGIENLNFKVVNIFNAANIIGAPFDFIYSLGNSLSLAWGDRAVNEMFQIIAGLMNKNGILFFQILNNDKPRSGYVNSKIVELSRGTRAFTVKRFEPDSKTSIMNVEFMTFHKESIESKYSIDLDSSKWKMVETNELLHILEDNHIQKSDLWASYDKTPFNPRKSDNLLFIGARLA